MYKLVILIESVIDWSAFDEAWPQFLHLVESMPALRREATCRVDAVLYGEYPVAFIHELYFDTLEDAHKAMASPQGRAAGKLLQEVTRGRMTLFFSDHKQDDIENIQKFKTTE
jgi:uncharacterized protein (TIGR02118 family)